MPCKEDLEDDGVLGTRDLTLALVVEARCTGSNRKKWEFPKIMVPFWRSHNKDYSRLGSILGPPILGNYQIVIIVLLVINSNRCNICTHCKSDNRKGLGF